VGEAQAAGATHGTGRVAAGGGREEREKKGAREAHTRRKKHTLHAARATTGKTMHSMTQGVKVEGHAPRAAAAERRKCAVEREKKCVLFFAAFFAERPQDPGLRAAAAHASGSVNAHLPSEEVAPLCCGHYCRLSQQFKEESWRKLLPVGEKSSKRLPRHKHARRQ
jgi:hypothetical protein